MELYIHIPFCVKKCAYCDFLSGVYDADIRRRYTDALCEELMLRAEEVSVSTAGVSAPGGSARPYIDSVYIGGGTPSWLELPFLEKIMMTARESFEIDPQAEVSIEVNPGTADGGQFRAYREMGINRISIGLQSANDDELALLGRIHDYNRFLHTYEYARTEGFSDINVDIMTGLPGQTPAKLVYTIRQIARLFPTHISAYALMIEEGTPFYDRYKFDAVKQHAGMETEELPNEDEEYELGKVAQYELTAAGYRRYEISNYAKPGAECRHNTGYWRRVPYIGVGLGAASLIGDVRRSNVRDIYKYIEAGEGLEGGVGCAGESGSIAMEPDVLFTDPKTRTVLSRREQMDEFFFLGLRMTEGVYRRDFVEAFGLEPSAIYKDVIEHLISEDLLISGGGRYALTEKGMDLSNYALAQFLG